MVMSGSGSSGIEQALLYADSPCLQGWRYWLSVLDGCDVSSQTPVGVGFLSQWFVGKHCGPYLNLGDGTGIGVGGLPKYKYLTYMF